MDIVVGLTLLKNNVLGLQIKIYNVVSMHMIQIRNHIITRFLLIAKRYLLNNVVIPV